MPCSDVPDSATLWTASRQAPLSMGFFRRGYRSGLPFSPPGDLSDSGIKRGSPASSLLAGGFFAAEQPGKPSALVLPNEELLQLSRVSRVRLCATPQTAAHQAPPSLGFSRQEHWSGLPSFSNA